MRIAFLNIYSGINNRGAESFTHELAKRLEKKHDVIFFKPDEKTWVVQPTNTTNIFKRFFLDRSSLSVLIFTLQQLPRLLKARPDLVIPINGFWQVLICKFFALKLLITGHSGPYWDERWNLYLKPSVFVATTGPTADWAKKVSPWTRVVTIPYGIDLVKFRHAKAVKLDIARPIVLCPAAAVPYKRVHLALEAVKKLKQGTLLHIGEGAPQNISYADIPSYYAACDVVTLPSTAQENSPMVFLEALAAGKTMVTTDTERARWILGGAGIYVNPEDTDAYAEALTKRLSPNVIEQQAKKYSWERVLTAYEELITTL